MAWNVLLLFLWIILGACLRSANLGLKPPWGDEWCTLIFSAGRGYQTIPLDRIISLDTLLDPLQGTVAWAPDAVVTHLLRESNHPPLYFLLTHLWLQFFPLDQGYISLVAGRTLSVVLGLGVIPAIFALTWGLTRSTLQAHMAALFMAISPFGVYLAQEARHYTLSLLWILGLLGFLQVGANSLRQQRPLAWWQIGLWISINGLGIATHFFYLFAWVAGMAVLLAVPGQLAIQEKLAVQAKLWGRELSLKGDRINSRIKWEIWDRGNILQFKSLLNALASPSLHRLLFMVLGTLVTGGIWLSTWRGIPDTALTHWLERSSWAELDSGLGMLVWLVEPLGRWIGWLVTMVILLPIEGVPTPIAITFGLLLLLGWSGLLRSAYQHLRLQLRPLEADPQMQRSLTLLLGFFGGTVGLFGLMVYGLGKDVTLAPRYHFVYFPVVIILVAITMAGLWQQSRQGKVVVVIFVAWGLLGSLSVVTNVAYQKPDQGDQMVQQFLQVQTEEQGPVQTLVAIAHRGHGETGKLINVAWELQSQINQATNQTSDQIQGEQSLAASGESLVESWGRSPQQRPQFLLAHWQEDTDEATQILHEALAQAPRPLSLWLINFSATHGVEPLGCELAPQFRPNAPGYWSRLYYCPVVGDAHPT